MFDVKNAKLKIDGMALCLPDYRQAFPWGNGQAAAAARSALSGYGEEIPVPLVGIYLPICKAETKWVMEQLETPSGRGSTNAHPCYRLAAKNAANVVMKAIASGHVIWEGTSVDILSADEANGGFGFEALAFGRSDHQQQNPVDGILTVKLGCCPRTVKVQAKELRPTFRRVDDKTARRGSKAGFVTANYSQWTIPGDDTEE